MYCVDDWGWGVSVGDDCGGGFVVIDGCLGVNSFVVAFLNLAGNLVYLQPPFLGLGGVTPWGGNCPYAYRKESHDESCFDNSNKDHPFCSP